MQLWDIFITQPMVNSLMFLYQLLFNNFTLSIVVFTVLVRALTYPLTYQQQKATKALTELQQSDRWKKMQEKYGKDREKMSQEQMKLMQEAGVNPFGSCLPTLIQFPILIGLYQAITRAMAVSPLQLLDLSQQLYKFLPNAATIIPLDNKFLWLNLGLPDPYFVLPLLVVVTSYVQSKMMTPATGGAGDPQMQQTTQMMGPMMAVMFGWISLNFPSGLSIYFVVANLIGVAQYALTTPVDWKNIFSLDFLGLPARAPAVPEKKKKK